MISNSGHINSVANNIYINNISKTSVKLEGNVGNSGDNDQIVLSNESQEFASYLNQLSSMSTVRTDKVSFYSKKIDNNDYKIDSGNIAEKILDGCFA